MEKQRDKCLKILIVLSFKDLSRVKHVILEFPVVPKTFWVKRISVII